ncbi:MAG: zinc ribbon domain-containing protein [Erysipelotrichaceae bacterium]|nr:zinc ribbon domain-containing protein [Erysipelotrichaceae bacterium]
MKCPRCHKEVKRGDKYCVHCGMKLIQVETTRQHAQNKQRLSVRLFNFLPTFLLILACLVMPIVYLRSYPNSSLNPFAPGTTTANEIGDIKENASMETVAVYKTTDAFKINVANASKFLDPVEAYVASLNSDYNMQFDTQYKIWVLRNNDIVIRVTCSTMLNDNEKLTITRRFNRTKTADTIKEELTKKNCTSFEDLCLNDQSELLTYMMGTYRYEALHKAFLEKESDFEKEKQTIGHYGYGAYVNNLPVQYGFNTLENKSYSGKVSQVIYRDGDTYYVKATHNYDGAYNLAR